MLNLFYETWDKPYKQPLQNNRYGSSVASDAIYHVEKCLKLWSNGNKPCKYGLGAVSVSLTRQIK